MDGERPKMPSILLGSRPRRTFTNFSNTWLSPVFQLRDIMNESVDDIMDESVGNIMNITHNYDIVHVHACVSWSIKAWISIGNSRGMVAEIMHISNFTR